MTRDEDWSTLTYSRTSRVALGAGIRLARRGAGMSQDQMAVHLAINISMVRQLESGAVVPDPGHLVFLGKLLEAGPATLFKRLATDLALVASRCFNDAEPNPDIASLFARGRGTILQQVEQALSDHFRVGQALTAIRDDLRQQEQTDAEADHRRDRDDRRARDGDVPSVDPDGPAT